MKFVESNNRASDARVSILHGATRTVFLVGPWAFKLPSLVYGWRPFLRGLIANAIEREWWQATHDERLCPVRFAIPGGWLLVMPRCDPLADCDEAFLDRFCEGDEYRIPAEIKIDSFGWLDPTHTDGAGRLVAIDYGN